MGDWVLLHPQADPTTDGNGVDAALVHTSTPSANLYTSLAYDAPAQGSTLLSYGYGFDTVFYNDGGSTGSGNGVLRAATMTVNEASSPGHPERFRLRPNASQQIQWKGDSGGPSFDANGWLMGIQSTGLASERNGQNNAATVLYADQIKIAPIRSWIESTMRGVANDFTKDGRPEILWHNADTGQLNAWTMNNATRVGQTFITATVSDGGPSTAYATTPWRPVGTNDFDGDGMTDILWYNKDTAQSQIWFMSGHIRTRHAIVDANLDGGGGNVGLPWRIAGTGDFNRDGSSDILWHNRDTGESQIWYMRGASRVSRQTVYGTDGAGSYVAAPWYVETVNDFNADGWMDILWRNSSTGEIQIWYLSNAARYTRLNVNATDGGGVLIDATWQVVGSGDFDLNGHTDIVWHNTSTHVTRIWYMTNNTRFGTADLSATDPGGVVIGAPNSIVHH